MPRTLEKEEEGERASVPHWLLARGLSKFLSMWASSQGILTTWQLDSLRESEIEKTGEQEGEGKCKQDRNQSFCILMLVRSDLPSPLLH